MELGFGNLRAQLATIVAEKTQESKKRGAAEAAAESLRQKLQKVEAEKAALKSGKDQRTEQAQAELQSLHAVYEKLRADQARAADEHQSTSSELEQAREKCKSLAAELVAATTETRQATSRLNQAEIQMSGFTHASASFESNYNTVQAQIKAIREARNQNDSAQTQLRQANEKLSEALRKSEAELGGYREREDESRRVAQQAIAEKENAHASIAARESTQEGDAGAAIPRVSPPRRRRGGRESPPRRRGEGDSPPRRRGGIRRLESWVASCRLRASEMRACLNLRGGRRDDTTQAQGLPEVAQSS